MTTTHRSDETIKMDVVEHLYWDDRFDASEITVLVEDGQVTVEGTVPTYFAKNMVAKSLLKVDGVVGVTNRLSVSEVREGDRLEDDEIHARARKTLSWDTSIDSTEIDVSVEDGVVTLTGNVNQIWKKYRAGEEVADIEGVRDVVNELTVVPSRDIEDELLAKELIKAFERNPFIDPDSITVTVEDKIVFLGGEVTSPRSRREAVDIARKSAGVKRIENNITIGKPQEAG